MKTTPPPKLISKFFFLFVFITLIIQALTAQNVLNQNGRKVYENNGKYFSMHEQDTVYIGTQFLTVVFNKSQEHNGKHKLISQYGLQFIGSTSGKYFVFRLPNSTKYAELVNSINTLTSVDYTILDILGKGSSATSTGVPNDPNPTVPDFGTQTWWVGDPAGNEAEQYLNLREAWGMTTANPSLKTAVENVRVAVIDDGIDWTQVDFPAQNSIGMDYTIYPPSSNTQMTCMSYPQNINGYTHGTGVASVIFSKSNNNTGIFGVAGGWKENGSFISEGVTPIIEVCRRDGTYDEIVYGYGGNSLALLSLCLQHAVDNGAKVINISINWVNATQLEMQPVIDKINDILYPPYPQKNNTTIIVSGGNYTPNTQNQTNVKFPATILPVIAVGGALESHERKEIDGSNLFTNGSCYGPGLDFVTSFLVPTNSGYCITPSSQLSILSGTSYSAAMLSGVVALMYAVNPCLSHQEVFEILKASCYKNINKYDFDPLTGWNDEVGYGFPNAYKAILLAQGEESYTLQTNETWTGTRIFRGDVIIPVGKKLTLDGATVKFYTDAGITLQGLGSLLEIRNQSKLTNVCNNMWKGISMVLNPNSPPNPFANQDIYINNSTIEYAINALNVPYGVKVIAKNNTRFTNNTLSAFFNAAYYKNLSWFENCTFENNEEHLDPDHAQYMVKMLQNTGAAFYGCNFINNIPASLIKKHGIYAYSSKFTVAGSCSNQLISPCPEGSIVYSSFSNFDYGVYALFATNGWKVERTNFTNNNCGIYTSSGQAAKMLKNNFMIPSNQDPDPRGAYFNNSSGFHIEGNSFTCSAVTHADEVGLYLRNTGPTQNYVYNNAFTNLFRGSVADGENRHATASTGLCYKCNDFSNNAYDIDIVRDDLVPLTSTYGINRNQGITSSNNPSTNKDTLAASNTFSTTPYQYNIHNTNNPSNYYFQESKVPAYAKIMPNPVLGINRYQNNSTTYNKPLVCKSWINSGGGIGQELAAKSLASSNAETADLQLINTVDGGSTTNLTFDITGSTPPEALTLREELLQKSPYLSDTVMKSAIGQENVLPNAMVRDILTENPQAAKSEEIMSMLDNRWEPMPDYMKEEIETGKTIIGGREQLEAIRDGWLQQESFLTNRIISTYLGDTVNPNAINELKAFLQNENTIQSGFVLADICLQRGDYGVSNQAINTIQTNFTLSQFESQQAADYLALNTILAGLHADTIELSSVDSVRAIPLFTLYQSGENNATAFARDILIASGLLSYQEPINLGNNEKAAIAQLPNIKSANTVKNSSEQLSIFPNPATTYTIIEYTLPANSSNSSVSIYNTHGVVVWQQEIKRAKDQVIIDLSNYTSGSYIVSLQLGNQTVASKSLSVTK